MSHEVDIHQTQTSILRELLFMPEASFTKLQKASHLDSDHFKFHLAKLVELGYINKIGYGRYGLSPKGKEHANKLDTDTNTIERQPKVSVVLILKHINSKGKVEYLCQQRLKNPYYGLWGRLGGKVQWDESFEDAAARELKEETGLTGKFVFRMVFRKRDYAKSSNELLEDKVFIIMECTKFSGKLIERFEGGLNKWMSQKELKSQPKYFESAYEFPELLATKKAYIQKDYFYSEDEY